MLKFSLCPSQEPQFCGIDQGETAVFLTTTYDACCDSAQLSRMEMIIITGVPLRVKFKLLMSATATRTRTRTGTMEVAKRKRDVSPANRNSETFPPKKSKPNPCCTDAKLLQLLDFSALDNISAISDRFDQVGNALLHDYILVVRCGEVETEFRILELEFYLQKHGCHEDPFTHGSEEQKICGRWYASVTSILPVPFTD